MSSASRFPQQRWQVAPANPDLAAQLAEAIDLSPLLAQVLINRGIHSPGAARLFLNPEQQFLPSPLDEFPDLPIALEILLRAIQTRQPIAICGDYDADGMTSTALLLRALRFLEAQVEYAIPSRMQEGYGINRRIIEEFHQEGVGLVLTVDNGIAAYEPIARARELGLTVIVTDHHDIPPVLPPANAILNPKLIREDSPYRGVAGVGVAYILAVCLAQCLQKTQDLTTPLIELFTLGTIADLAPLTGVNRRWVKRGLRLLPQSKLLGVQALIQVAGLSQEKALKPEAIGFRLGPRINAIGRMSDPQIVIELLTTDHEGRALELAMKCEQVNQLRQRLCELIEQDAIAWCEQVQFNPQQDRVLVIVQPDWHHGVIGIVASRLLERYGVPVFIGTYEDVEESEGESQSSPSAIRGSARGIPEFNVFEALQFCGDILDKFGGHRAAGGFSLQASNLEEMRSRLKLYAHHQLQLEHLKPLVSVDVEASFQSLTFDLFHQIDQLHPCGIENPDPVFYTSQVRILDQQQIGQDRKHLKLTLIQGNTPIKALAWRWGEYFPLPSPIDIAYRLRLNEWNGEKTIELELIGIRFTPPSLKPPIEPPLLEPVPTLIKEKGELFGNGSQTKVELAQPTQTAQEFPPLDLPEPPQICVSEDHPSISQAEAESGVEFYYSKRKYFCTIAQNTEIKELHISNFEGEKLVVQPQEKRGWLSKDEQPSEEIDISHLYYFNLIRSALSALEVAEKNQIIHAKDQLIAEKDQQIATLTQQLALLQQKVSQSPEQQLQQLQAELQMRQATIEAQEAHILQLQSQLSQPASKPEDIRQTLKAQLGELWQQLDSRTQKELMAAYQHRATPQSPIDYSEAGSSLVLAIEREIISPFFKAIQLHLAQQNIDKIGGIPLKSRKKYTLSMLPPLLAEQWNLLEVQALPSVDLLRTSATSSVALTDRDLVQQFLQQWHHPLANWLQQESAASTLAQIDQLRSIAAQNLLNSEQFSYLERLILGGPTQPGLLQAIYSISTPVTQQNFL